MKVRGHVTANIIIQNATTPVGDVLDAIGRHLTQLGATLQNSDIFLCHLPERAVEHRHVMLDPKSYIGIEVKRLVNRRLLVRRPQRDCLVAILFREFDAAVEVAMGYVATPENDQAGLQFLLVDYKGHHNAPLCRICVD
jgi:hypothetical protein